jgi:polar amino acid transport system substrate-binding protein
MKRPAASVLVAFVAVVLAGTCLATAQTLDRVASSGVVRIGHRVDAPPFSFVDNDGAPSGYTVELCKRIAEAIGAKVGREVTTEFVALDTENRFQAVSDGRVDMHCGAATATLGRREQVDFSLPIFITGVSALMSADAPRFLRDVLAGETAQVPPRLAVLQAFQHRRFGVRSGTTAETWLREQVNSLAANAEVVAVGDHAEGLAGVASGDLDAYFADRALLLGQVQMTENPDNFLIGDRLFTYEPYAIALPRGDEDLRLVVDRTLSNLVRSDEYRPLFGEYFGAPSEAQQLMLNISTLPE